MKRVHSVYRLVVVAVSAVTVTLGLIEPAAAAPITEATVAKAPSPTKNERVGSSVAVSADDTIAMAGGQLSAYKDATTSGSVYVYTSSGPGTTWTVAQTLTAPDATSNDRFGSSIALSDDGTTAVIAAQPWVGTSSAPGQVYVFTRVGSIWTEVQKIDSPSGTGSSFGTSLDISSDGTHFVVGAPCAEGSACNGTAYFFSKPSGASEWSLNSTISCATASGGQCGGAVAMSPDGTTAAVGQPYYNYMSGTSRQYRPHVFTYKRIGIATSWSYQATIAAPTADGVLSDFGNYDTLALSSDGTVLSIGAPRQQYVNTTSIGGAVYTYRYSAGSWGTPSALTIAATSGTPLREFGRSIDLSADGLKLLVGEPQGSATTAAGGGIAYYYTRTSVTSAWTNAASYQSPDLASGDKFGYSVAMPASATRPVIGAPFKPSGPLAQAGAGYIY